MKTAPDKAHPFNASHLQIINDNLRALHDLQGMMDRCSNCGLDMADYEAERQRQIELFTKIKQEFFPDN